MTTTMPTNMPTTNTVADESVSNVVFDRRDFADDTPHEQVIFCQEPSVGLKAIIAIHSTTLGPALGGTRFYPYRDEHAALTDALRLSRGMTYKSAVADLPLGGGKAVIIGDPKTTKTPELLRAYGEFVDSLAGRYITAGDVGTTSADMDVIGESTEHVVAKTSAAGGSGDSAPLTASGVFHSMMGAAQHVWGRADLADRVIGIEGAGKVGHHLATLLSAVGAQVVVADIDQAALSRLKAAVPEVRIVDNVIDQELDVYAPCAMGATLTKASVHRLRARIVCGAANNQLASPDVERSLIESLVTWVPDFVANSGGLIQVCGELNDVARAEVLDAVAGVQVTVGQILEAQRSGTAASAGQAALGIAHARLQNARGWNRPV